uniref:Uncharacterized protein n=1 Tax=Anguilla anguilla TaxID=7936 RepID=A0A0E9S8E2_ANGAN
MSLKPGLKTTSDTFFSLSPSGILYFSAFSFLWLSFTMALCLSVLPCSLVLIVKAVS